MPRDSKQKARPPPPAITLALACMLKPIGKLGCFVLLQFLFPEQMFHVPCSPRSEETVNQQRVIAWR